MTIGLLILLLEQFDADREVHIEVQGNGRTHGIAQSIVLTPAIEAPPLGYVTISNATPREAVNKTTEEAHD